MDVKHNAKYCFSIRGNINDQLVSIADGCINKAILCIENPGRDRAEEVHTVRTSIKQIRALWRLVRPTIPKDLYLQNNTRLRDSASRLSQARDAIVAHDTLENMLEKVSGKKNHDSFVIVLEHFTKQRPPQDQLEREREVAMHETALMLRKESRSFHHLNLPANGWEAIEPGLHKIYSSTRKRMRRAYESGKDENFHEWRKSVKYLWYQMQLVEPAWPKRLGKVVGKLKKLQQKLGDSHDLVVLTDLLQKNTDRFGGLQTVGRVIDSINMQKQKLRKECRSLGEKLFSCSPKKFIRKVGKRWNAIQQGA